MKAILKSSRDSFLFVKKLSKDTGMTSQKWNNNHGTVWTGSHRLVH